MSLTQLLVKLGLTWPTRALMGCSSLRTQENGQPEGGRVGFSKINERDEIPSFVCLGFFKAKY